jgi:2-alkyl-3-oxoalkanoate reductase
MRVFVTGATGVIGQRVLPQLLAAGHQVTAVSRRPEQSGQLARTGATPVRVDLFDRADVQRAVVGHEMIINLATHIPLGTRMFLPGAWRENDRIRREVPRNLVQAALAMGVPRIIQESFAPVYPSSGDAWIDETMPIRPARYNRTVAVAEQAIAHFTDQGGVGIVLRFANFYGPDAAQTHDLIRFVRRGWVPMPGDPDAFLSWISHDDAASAVLAVLQAPAGAYNVVDDEPFPRRECFAALAAALGVATPKIAPAWTARLMGSLGETLTRSLRVSNHKLKTTCDWAPQYSSVREGWRAVVAAMGTAEADPRDAADDSRRPTADRPAA